MLGLSAVWIAVEKGRAERSMSLRLREEIQEMLWRGDGGLNSAAQDLWSGISQPRSEGGFLVLRYINIGPTSPPVPSFPSAASRLDFARLRLITYWSLWCHFHETLVQLECT
jgi:hypothetical protein